MSPPEFVNTEPFDVHLVDTSEVRVERTARNEPILTAIEAIRETTSRKQAIEALEALLHVQVEAGAWQLVPVEPTPEMIAAAACTPGMRAIDSASSIHQLRGNPLPADAFAEGSPLQQAYRAMLVSAPGASLAAPAAAQGAREQEAEWLRELLRRSMGYVKEASTRYYDGADGASIRASAASLLKKIEAALAATPAPEAAPATSTGDARCRVHFIKGWDECRMYENLPTNAESDQAMRERMPAYLAATPAPEAAPAIDPHEAVRALAIADQAMFNVLSSNCAPGDRYGTVLGLVCVMGGEVNKLADADRQILEAFDWLRLRGYVGLAADARGEHIIVMRRPGEE